MYMHDQTEPINISHGFFIHSVEKIASIWNKVILYDIKW